MTQANLDFSALAKAIAPVAPAVAQVADSSGKPKPKAKLWLNVGNLFPVLQDDGSVAEEFVSTFGTPLDYYTPLVIGHNARSHWRSLGEIKNAMGDSVMTIARSLKPGEFWRSEPGPIMIEIRVVDDSVAEPLPAGENPGLGKVVEMFRTSTNESAE